MTLIPPHLLTALDALVEIKTAMKEAASVLPEAVRQQHSSSYETLREWYRTQPDARPAVQETLADLVTLAVCKEQLLALAMRTRTAGARGPRRRKASPTGGDT